MKYILRVGLGRSESGKILDSNTNWYVYQNSIDERENAIRAAITTNRDIYISVNKGKYHKISFDQIRNLKI